MMTFEQFQATRQECDDIGSAISAEFLGAEGEPLKVAGYLYCETLYIERLADGVFNLQIYNEQYMSSDPGASLESLERELYQFAIDEEYC